MVGRSRTDSATPSRCIRALVEDHRATVQLERMLCTARISLGRKVFDAFATEQIHKTSGAFDRVKYPAQGSELVLRRLVADFRYQLESRAGQ